MVMHRQTSVINIIRCDLCMRSKKKLLLLHRGCEGAEVTLDTLQILKRLRLFKLGVILSCLLNVKQLHSTRCWCEHETKIMSQFSQGSVYIYYNVKHKQQLALVH